MAGSTTARRNADVFFPIGLAFIGVGAALHYVLPVGILSFVLAAADRMHGRRTA